MVFIGGVSFIFYSWSTKKEVYVCQAFVETKPKYFSAKMLEIAGVFLKLHWVCLHVPV